MSRLRLRALGPIGIASVVVAGALRALGADQSGAAATPVSASAAMGNPSAQPPQVGGPLARADDARQRAASARQGGDIAQAELLEALAREWTETAQSLVVAQNTESKASQIERQTAELEAKISRARTLLEETVARRGRARATLDALAEARDAGVVANDGGSR